MKGSKRRPEQVAETIRQVIAESLLGDLRDPRIGFVTVTHVQVTGDLSVATVRVSVMGDDSATAEALAGLQSAAGLLRSRVSKAIATRVAPELRFELDRGLAHAARIEQILADLRQEKGD
jgi:ribosome-binding factor A